MTVVHSARCDACSREVELLAIDGPTGTRRHLPYGWLEAVGGGRGHLADLCGWECLTEWGRANLVWAQQKLAQGEQK